MLPFLRSLQLRLATLRRRELLDQDLQDELAFHMAMRAEKLAEQGVDTSDAPATAQRRFGNATTIRENLRAQWSFPAIESWWQDLRHAARALRRTPGFTAVAVLSLSIGIGGNTAVFSTLHALYLRSLPVGNPEELRIPTWAAKGRTPAESISGYRTQYNALVVNGSFSWDVYTGIALAPPFQSVAGWANYQTNISHRGDAFVAPAHLITSNYFDTLRVQLVAGRSFLPEENTAGGQPVVLISARLARRLFGTEAAALGSAV
ncbi:MAG TPA: ABC transporter permease, partial [Bryobacteraceae bacterium]|nr:ABC transporter permease [Bryobacteraceae bacterium]